MTLIEILPAVRQLPTLAWISTEHYLPKIWADRMHSYRLPGVVTPAGTEPVRICAVVGGPFYA